VRDSASARLLEAAGLFLHRQDHRIRRLVVLDHDQRPAGIVSLSDVAVATDDVQLAGTTLERICELATPAP
jgi:hypothetical protein